MLSKWRSEWFSRLIARSLLVSVHPSAGTVVSSRSRQQSIQSNAATSGGRNIRFFPVETFFKQGAIKNANNVFSGTIIRTIFRFTLGNKTSDTMNGFTQKEPFIMQCAKLENIFKIYAFKTIRVFSKTSGYTTLPRLGE